jgi:2-oxoglutarate ferredoxin oxidoreductase subunit delta
LPFSFIGVIITNLLYKKFGEKVPINKVTIYSCKGCELCIIECKQEIIKISSSINAQGYYPAEITDQNKCTGCKFCAIACPDAVIEIERLED